MKNFVHIEDVYIYVIYNFVFCFTLYDKYDYNIIHLLIDQHTHFVLYTYV